MTSPSNRITLERPLDATPAEVWSLWTTPAGIERWWGPPGFQVTVQQLELWPGGVMLYTMTAVDPEMVAFMKRNGMPVANQTRITFTEVVPNRRLAYINLVDFVPGVTAYDVGTVVEILPRVGGVTLRLRLDPMHSPEWTQRAVMGWEGELGKLVTLLDARPPAHLCPPPGLLPCLWFDGRAEEAIAFYLEVFGDGCVLEERRCGPNGPGPEGSLLTAVLELRGQRLMLLNGGPVYQLNEAFSLVARCADQAEVDRLWTLLTEGGQEQPCGWCKDRFGLSWQVVPDGLVDLLFDADAAAAGRAMAAMYTMRKLDLAAVQAAHAG